MSALRLAVLLVAAGSGLVAGESLQQAFTRLYNFDFRGAQQALDSYVAEKPDDPLGYAIRSSAYLFSELHRMGVLESEFLASDRRIISRRKKVEPDPEIRRCFKQATAEARRCAEAHLARDPNDRNALFAMCIVSGVETDYAAMVEKRPWGSLSHARQSQVYATRLLKEDPTFYDAYLTQGFNEYLVGSLPFFVRWFVRFDQVEGSKQKAVRELRLVARSGRYLGPFAKILLAIVSLREKRPRDSVTLLRELAHDYPENPLIRTELARLSAGMH